MAIRSKNAAAARMVPAPEVNVSLASQNASINTTLVEALVRAHLWQRQLKSGKYQTMQDNCAKLKYCSFFITRTFCLKCSEYVIIYLFRLRYISLTILGTQKFINS